MIKASAPAKLILFGEHVVVYGEPAIATAVDKRAYVTAEQLDSRKIIVTSKNFGTEIESSIKGKTDCPIVRAAQIAIEKKGIAKGVSIEVDSQIPVSVGLGSSASLSVATAAAVIKLINPETELTKMEIMEVAYGAEKIAHGTTSGLAVAAATFGGTIFFQKGNIEGLGTSELELVVGNTKVPRNTKDIVEKIKGMIEDPRIAYNLFTIGSVVRKAREALLGNNIQELGSLMSKNQEFLRALGVSTLELEKLIQIAKEKGAYGAKLTGAGAGGCMIAVSENPGRIKTALEQAEAEAFIVKTNQIGVRAEG